MDVEKKNKIKMKMEQCCKMVQSMGDNCVVWLRMIQAIGKDIPTFQKCKFLLISKLLLTVQCKFDDLAGY